MVFATNNYFLHADVPFWEFALAEYPATCQPMRKKPSFAKDNSGFISFVSGLQMSRLLAVAEKGRIHTKARATTFAATTALSFKGATGFV